MTGVKEELDPNDFCTVDPCDKTILTNVPIPARQAKPGHVYSPAPPLDRPQPVRFVLVVIIACWPRDQLCALAAEVVEPTPHFAGRISLRRNPPLYLSQGGGLRCANPPDGLART